MKSVLQRVARAEVRVEGSVIGSIERGLMVLVGVAEGDTEADADALATKVTALRIFEDGAGKMNLSVADIAGSVLAISQFTLLADTSRGRRPSFTLAMRPRKPNDSSIASAKRCARTRSASKPGASAHPCRSSS
jgi:D-tyrosyl-tRNA(Tyr) deacylase